MKITRMQLRKLINESLDDPLSIAATAYHDKTQKERLDRLVQELKDTYAWFVDEVFSRIEESGWSFINNPIRTKKNLYFFLDDTFAFFIPQGTTIRDPSSDIEIDYEHGMNNSIRLSTLILRDRTLNLQEIYKKLEETEHYLNGLIGMTSEQPLNETKMTCQQLRKLIREAVIQFPTQARKKELLAALKQELMSNYDMDDPSMKGAGFVSWVEQVNNAVKYVDLEVGDDLSKFEAASSRAYEMLMMAEFGEWAQYGSMARASDVEDLDDEFASYLDNLARGDVEELPYDEY